MFSFAPGGIVATAQHRSLADLDHLDAVDSGSHNTCPPIELVRDPLALLPLRVRDEREVRRERNVAPVGGEDAAVLHAVERTQLGLPIADR